MSVSKVFKAGDVAVILGAATGIGRATATKLAAIGAKLALFDISDELNNTASSLSSTEVLATVGDISNEKEVASFKTAVYDKYGRVDFLFVNAGIGPASSFNSTAVFHKTLAVNFFGYVNAVAAFYDSIVAQKSAAYIVLTGSKQGITNPPGNPAYNASKAAVKSYAEGLSFALKDTPIHVALVVPGWTHTNLTGNKPEAPKPKPAGAWEPEQVADYLFEGLATKSFYIICPDNEVTEEMDKKRMLWSVGDIVENRPPLSRWRGQEFVDAFNKTL